MNRPHYTMFVAMTVDGKIARDSNHLSTDWTSEEDKVHFRSHLAKQDAVIVGRNTYEVSHKPLSRRNCLVFTSKSEGIEEENENLIWVNPEKADFHTYLMDKGWKEVAILGGVGIHTYFLDHDLLDDLYVTVEPIVFGSGLDLFSSDKSRDVHVRLVSAEQMNERGTMLLHYAFER